jgi:hypothetical protein
MAGTSASGSDAVLRTAMPGHDLVVRSAEGASRTMRPPEAIMISTF